MIITFLASHSRRCGGIVAASLVLLSSLTLTVACSSGTSTVAAVGNGSDGLGDGGTSGDGSAGSTLVACDPLAAAPTTLPAIIGIGKDKNGVLYVAAGAVADQPVPRVFVMESGVLHEQRIIGSGGSGSSDYNLDFVDPASSSSAGRTLLLHVVSGKATAMALGTPNTKGFIGDPSEANDEMLTLQDPSVVANVMTIGLPLQPEHVARTDDGHLLVVTFDDSSPHPIRVFYGTNGGTLFERKVLQVGAEAQDEGIMFDVDGETYSVNFHVPPVFKGGDGGTSSETGEIGNSSGSSSLTILPLTTSLAGDTFECFSGS